MKRSEMSRKRTIDRNAVLDAAEHIVSTQGAAALTIDAVAKASGITKGGVQYCFGNKQDMIAAMVARWGGEFDDEVAAITGPDASGLDKVRAHIKASALADEASSGRASVMMATLLQAPGQMEENRNWYRERLAGIDLNSDANRKLRLAFLACEGAFLLRSFNFMAVSDEEWRDIFADIERLLMG